MLKKSFISLFCLLLSLTFFSCTVQEADNSGTSYTHAILCHFGFDFSARTVTQNTPYDGETTNWTPGGQPAGYPSYAQYLWWRNSHLDTVTYKNQTKDMGEVSLDSVTEIPSSWDVSPNPLIANHVIVAKCSDGYVKFQVLAVGTANILSMLNISTSDIKEQYNVNNFLTAWPAYVKYAFTSGTTF